MPNHDLAGLPAIGATIRAGDDGERVYTVTSFRLAEGIRPRQLKGPVRYLEITINASDQPGDDDPYEPGL